MVLTNWRAARIARVSQIRINTYRKPVVLNKRYNLGKGHTGHLMKFICRRFRMAPQKSIAQVITMIHSSHAILAKVSNVFLKYLTAIRTVGNLQHCHVMPHPSVGIKLVSSRGLNINQVVLYS